MGSGLCFHMRERVDIQLPSRAGRTRLFPESGESRCQTHLGQVTMQDPLRLSSVLGSSLEKWFLCFSLLINAIEGSSLCSSPRASPRVWLPLWQHMEQGSDPMVLIIKPEDPGHSSTSPM